MPHLSLRHPEALPLWQATADLHLYRRCKHSSGSVSVGSLGPGAHKVLFEPSETLWRLWGLILNAILPLLPSCWGFSFALGHGVPFFGGIEHSPVSVCSGVSCNFGVLTEDEHMSLYSATLRKRRVTIRPSNPSPSKQMSTQKLVHKCS